MPSWSKKAARRYYIRILFKDEHALCSANCNNEVMSLDKYMSSKGQLFCNTECLRNFTGRFTGETSEAARTRLAEEAVLKDPKTVQLLNHFLGI
nr:MAG: hypothetical protein Ga0209084_10007149 [Lavidaviridae sp.]